MKLAPQLAVDIDNVPLKGIPYAFLVFASIAYLLFYDASHREFIQNMSFMASEILSVVLAVATALIVLPVLLVFFAFTHRQYGHFIVMAAVLVFMNDFHMDVAMSYFSCGALLYLAKPWRLVAEQRCA